MSNINDIIAQLNKLSGYNLPSSSVLFTSGALTPSTSSQEPEVIVYVPAAPPYGTIPTEGIYPGGVIKSDQILRIINALNGINVDTIIISGSFNTSGSNTLNGELILPFVEEGNYLIVSGGVVQGTNLTTVPFAISASHADNATTASYALFSEYGTGVIGATATLTQTVPVTIWNFNHRLGVSYPVITIYDDVTNSIILPESITPTDANNIQIRFSTPTKGRAVAVVGGGYFATTSGSTRQLTQSTPSTVWSFNHGLGDLYPVIQVYDSNDNVVYPTNIHAVDLFNTEITFNTPVTGTAIASVGGLVNNSASYATSASYAKTAGNASTSSFAVSASYSVSSSLAQQARSASYAGAYTLTSSFNLFTSSYLAASASFDTRILTNSASIASLSSSYLIDSASFNVKINNNSASIAALSASYLQSSASFNSRILSNSASIAALSASYLQSSASFNSRILTNSSSIAALSASYLIDSASFNTKIAANSSSISTLSSSFLAFSSSYNTGSFTGSFTGSLSNLKGTPTHIPYFSQSQVLANSVILQVDNGPGQGSSVAINVNGVDTDAPEALYVYQESTSSYNVISGKGNLNSFLQLNIQNLNNGDKASSDVVATANNGTTGSNYIDFGINNGSYLRDPNWWVGQANDTYLVSIGNNHYMGSVNGGDLILFTTGSTFDGDASAKLILRANDIHEMSGSFYVHGSIFGTLHGNADTATTASNALTASSADNFFVRNNATVVNTLTAQTLIVQTVTSSIVYSSGSNTFGNQLTDTQEFTGSVTVTGSLEVNGHKAVDSSMTASMTVLSASYAITASYAQGSNATVSASYALSASYAETAPYYLTTASYLVDSGSFSLRDTNLEATASNLIGVSASFSDRISNNEVTGSNLTFASASFSTRVTVLEGASASLNLASASFSTRVTNNELTGSTLVAASASLNVASASLSSRVTNNELTSSTLVIASASFSTRVTNNELTSSTLIAASASFSTRMTNNELTASVLTSASASFVLASGSNSTRVTNLEATASQFVVASSSLSTRATDLESTASILVNASASFASTLVTVLGNYATTGSNTFKGVETVSGAIKFALSNDPDPTGADGIATYLFESASNTAMGRDLYFRQDGNVSKWKWTEAQLNTGLLHGGLLNYSGSNIYVSSGSGIIVSYNATPGAEVSPIVQYVTWNAITASATYLTSSQQTYVYIDSTGALQQQTSWYTPSQYVNAIPLGVLYHANRNLITAASGDTAVAYGVGGQSFQFIRAFGPLKLNGLTVTPATGSLGFSIGPGTSYILGGFYEQDLNNPSFYDSAAIPTASFARWYRGSGSFISDNNNGAFYTTIDNQHWDNGSGTLQLVENNTWTIQRVFFNPINGRSTIYYGQKTYASLADAQSNLSTDPFTEGTLTAHNNIFVAYLIVQGNASNTNLSDTNVNTVVQSGLFRNTAGGSGGTTFTTTLESLSDVTVTSPTNGQALIYQGGLWINGTPNNAATASYVLQAVSASFATTALNAPYYTLTASYNATSASLSSRVTRNELTASALVAASASFSTRVTNNELTSSTLVLASASFSTRVSNNETTGSILTSASASFAIMSGSLSTRATNLESTASQYVVTSGSLAIRVADLESTASTLTVASASFALVSASFSFTSGSLSDRTTLLEITSSTLVNASASFSARVSNNEVTGSNLTLASSSFSIRTTDLESTASNLVNASASFSTRNTVLEATASTLVNASASFSTRVTNTELTASTLVAASASFEANYVRNSQTASMTVLSSSYALTASYALNVPLTASYALTASYVLLAESASYALTASAADIFKANEITASNITVLGEITAQTLNVQQVTSSIVYSSGSNKFGSLLGDTQELTGSVTVTGSFTVNGNSPLYINQTSSLTVASASHALTASSATATATIPFNVGNTSTYVGMINSTVIGGNNLFTVPTGSYTAATFQYTVYQGTNSRAGQLIASWNNGNVQFTDFSTLDNGSTAAVTASVIIALSQLKVDFITNTSGWTIKSQGTLI